jgi:hypothetical protein
VLGHNRNSPSFLVNCKSETTKKALKGAFG